MSSETDVTGLMKFLFSDIVKAQNNITELISEQVTVSSETDVTGLMKFLFSDVTMKQNNLYQNVSTKSSNKALEATKQREDVVYVNYRIKSEIDTVTISSISEPQSQDIGYHILQSSDIIILNHD
ncbi:MAG: hypothetical protein HN452_03360 [Thaumarchaeota archaeon]|nr:hypothetical protein [Nitrososphaerota archaeon]